MVDEKSTSGKKKQDYLVGTTIAERYKVLSVIGYGTTTSVYKAEDTLLNRPVVLKMLHTHSMDNEFTVLRFEQECKTLALLKHPNIVTHYDSGLTGQDQPFLVMEFLDGKTIKQIIEESGALGVKEAVSIFIQACAGLAAAHQKDVVHRDMKPANIMVVKDEHGIDHVKLLDFGVAKILVQGDTFQTKTQTGEMLGTLLYMSPEQCLDEFLDCRSDVYSLGCVFYEALTGVPPLCGRTAFETMNKHLSQKPQKLASARPDLTFPDHLERIVQKAVEKSPAQRYQTINAFEEDLKKFLKEIQAKPSIVEKRKEVEPPSVCVSESDSESLETFLAEPEIAKVDDSSKDTSRDGTIYFLASESLEGVNWQRIYSEMVKSYRISESEVHDEQMRLISKRNNLREMEKFALEKFSSMDTDNDGFVSREELVVALKASKDFWRDVEFISFLLDNLEQISNAGSPRSLSPWHRLTKGITVDGIKEYFRSFGVDLETDG